MGPLSTHVRSGTALATSIPPFSILGRPCPSHTASDFFCHCSSSIQKGFSRLFVSAIVVVSFEVCIGQFFTLARACARLTVVGPSHRLDRRNLAGVLSEVELLERLEHVLQRHVALTHLIF